MKTLGRTLFGERLVQSRKHAKFTQINAAKAVNMSQGTLAELEREGQGSSYTAQLAVLYEVNPSWLATGKGDMFKSPAHIIEPNQKKETQPFLPEISSEILAVIEIMKSTDDQGRQLIRIKAEELANERQVHLKRLALNLAEFPIEEYVLANHIISKAPQPIASTEAKSIEQDILDNGDWGLSENPPSPDRPTHIHKPEKRR